MGTQGASVTGRSLFSSHLSLNREGRSGTTDDFIASSLSRRPLSGATFLPTSDTAVPSHNSKLLLKPSSSLLPSLSYLDPREDLFLFVLFSWTAGVCLADRSVKRRGREGE